jgi:SAM-dependent methyltransferase
MKNLKIYERLSRIYDLDWGKFSLKFVGFVEELLSEHNISSARILDLACGTGNFAIQMVRDGHIVRGIDISSEMINIARSKSAGLSGVSFEIQDMTEFSVKNKFDAVTCIFDSINYVHDINRLKSMIGRVEGVLKGKELFVFDSNTERLYAEHKGSRERKLGDTAFTHECRYDPNKKEAVTLFAFPDGAVETHRQRPYDLRELRPALIESGLHIINTYSNPDKAPYDAHSKRLICVAQKKKTVAAGRQS